MAVRERYITLMASLPYIGQLFAVKQTPLSRLKLERRLQMLEHDDAVLLRRIEALLDWAQLPMDRSDAEIIAQAQRLLSWLDNALLRDIVAFRLELRTVMAALRRRKRGEGVPRSKPWGYGRWVDQIQRYWTEPGFRLEGVFPWITDAHRLLQADDSVGLERLLTGVIWDELGRAAEGHYFDLEAVVTYVLRWNVVERWTDYNGEAAVKRFTKLVDAGIGQFEEIFA